VKGATPPLAWTVSLYGASNIPLGTEAVVIVRRGGGCCEIACCDDPPPHLESRAREIKHETTIVKRTADFIFITLLNQVHPS
jgi:hypothetical protein